MVADGIIGEGLAVKTGALIFPIGIGITIGDGPRGRTGCSGGIGVLFLLQEIAAGIIAVGDGLI